MKLLVDIGNSRVKWATLNGGRLAEQQAPSYAGWTPDDWRRELFPSAGIDAVLAASVSAAPSAGLVAAAGLVIGRRVSFVSPSREAGGVRNAYREPQLLGVDRWLAVIAGHAATRGACCVADVGTAATFDGVTADGQHLGGFIVPGPELMVRSLHGGTADLAGRTAASGASGDAPLADNTRDAIERGGSYETAWAWLHKRRRAMVRPDRDQLAGEVEVDETRLGEEAPGIRGRRVITGRSSSPRSR